MKIKNVIICISLLFILLTVSCVSASQEIDTDNTMMASDTVIDEVSSDDGLQENVVSEESGLSGKLGSVSNENVLCKTDSSESQSEVNGSGNNGSNGNVLAASSNSINNNNNSLGAKKVVSTNLVTPSRAIYVSTAGSGYTYQVILKDANGKGLSNKVISFDFNGKTKTAKTNNIGWASVILNANAAGNYDVKVTFAGDSNYAKISQKATIRIVKEHTKFVAPGRALYVKDVVNGYTYPAILKNKDGVPLANKKVMLTINNKKQVATTDKNGYVYFTIKLNSYGAYVIDLKFAGSAGYYDVVEHRDFKLFREPTKFVAPSRVLYVTDVVNGYKYSAILKTKDNMPLANKKVTIKLNNKKYSATTDKSGWATVDIIPAKEGINDLEITYGGDNCFKPVTEHRTIKLLASPNPYGNKAKKAWINADSGSDDMKKAVAELLRQNGWTVYVGQTYSNAHYTDYFKVTSDYQVYITLYNGFCAGTIREAYSSSIQNTLNKKGVTLVVMWDTRDWVNPDGMAPYKYGDFTGYNAKRAWDDNFSVGDPGINNVAGYLKDHNAKYCAAPTAEGLVAQFLAGGYLAMNSK